MTKTTKENIIRNAIKLSLAVLLFCCLLELPYWYYQFVRFAACIGLCTIANYSKSTVLVVFAYNMAILFNPVIPVQLSRPVWNVADIIVGTALLVWAIIDLYISRNEGWE
jgi:hypothetical protein